MADSYTGLGTITAKWLREPHWANTPKVEFPMARQVISFPGTITAIEQESPSVPLIREFTFLSFSKAEEYELLSFFCEKQGRLKKFWIPSWVSAFTLKSAITIASNQVKVNHVNFQKVYSGYERIRLLLSNGDTIVRKIINVVETDKTEEVLTVDTVFDRSIAIGSVVLFDLFLLCRSDIDSFQLEYVSAGVSECSVRVAELIREYP